MDENVFGERYLTPEENLKKQEMYRNMSENISQMVIDKDEKTGKLILENNEFDIIKEDDSDSWQIIRQYEEEVFKRDTKKIAKEIMDEIWKRE